MIDIESVRARLGAMEEDHDEATAAPLRGMAATFGRRDKTPDPGSEIQPGWHLAYFPDATPLARLGEDGLPLERGVLPRMPLPRRMYAGVALTFHAPILVGDTLRRETEFTDVQLREGSTGTLILATTTRRIYTPRGLALTEDSHSVFREAVPAGTKSGIPKTEPPPADMQWSRTITPDPVTLFRYSALTFNPHRIHYDRPYAMQQEGYPGLVVHGPFTQQCLLDLLRDNTRRRIAAFSLRARAPLFDVAAFTVVGRTIEHDQAELFAVTPQGGIAIQARARLE
ncbi:MaoC family dehydratase N-terminal domain-containing protein [Acidisphaera sp. S103]|uniref:FAS1-like dehydratase domain-containing protein n=1 Tax=Acidisphaera sp. S103 TaxID=1747223 RepID=UPI00131E7BBB|nr:MaoC family dehydratase N-terminal domain-containing protein [Acidisphaera sp. S103]